MAAVIRTIGSANDDGAITGLRILTVTGAGPWDIVFNQSPNYTVTVGDFIKDSSLDTYVVTGVTDATNIEVTDELGVGHAIVTATCNVDRGYTTLTLAEAAISADVASGDTLTWSVMNDSLISDTLNVNDTTLGTGGTLLVTAPEPERHNGVIGAGSRLQGAGANQSFVFEIVEASCPTITVEHLEFIGQGSSTANAFLVWIASNAAANTSIARSLIIHDQKFATSSTGSGSGLLLNKGAGPMLVENCLIFDIDGANTTGDVVGILIDEDSAGTRRISNCTLERCTDKGVHTKQISADTEVRNTAVFNSTLAFVTTGSWNASSGNNCTDAASAPGGGNQVSKTDTDQFVDLTDGSEEYTVKAGADLIDNGADLSGTFTDDIAGVTRSTPWEIGAYNLPVVSMPGRTDPFGLSIGQLTLGI